MALVCALILCVSMLTGIVLPFAEQSAAAVTDSANAYAEAEKHASKLTVSPMGTVSPKPGLSLPVPEEYREMDIYLPDGKLYLYNPSWRKPANAGVSNEGDYFFAQYGDGTTWGNGKVYLVQWAVNAFGGEWADANSDPKNFTVLQNKIATTIPTEGGDNNHYVLLFPGKFGSGSSKQEGALPAGVSDPTAADLNTVHYLGPQAGVSPVGEDPTAGVANGRSLDLTREFSFQSYYYNVKNVVTHFDGIAMNSWGSFRGFEPWNGNANIVLNTGLYIENLYADQDQNDTLFFLGWYETWGTPTDPANAYAGHNAVTTVIEIKDSYAKRSIAADGTNPWNMEAADLKIEGCVFDGIGPAAANTREGEFAIDAPNKKMTDRAFLGEGRNKWNVEITNNTFLNSTASTLIKVFGGDLWDFGENASIDFSGNRVLNYGNTLAANTVFQLDCMDRDGWYDVNGNKNLEEVHKANVSFCDNYITINKAAAATGHQFCVFHSNSVDLDSKAFTLRGNTIVGTKLNSAGNKWHYDFASSNALQDISGNLFLDYDNRVRAPRISTVKNEYSEYCVQSEIYASDEKVGGVKELFTVTESPKDLFVAHSMIQTVVEGNDTADLGYIRGTITVYPENGVTYETDNLFAFGNKEVELIGVYGTEEDAVSGKNKLFTLAKGFGTAYAKAEYKAGNTTATVIYTVVEPTKFHVVAPENTTSYEFNGTTYTGGNVVFYTTLADAVAGSNNDWENRADIGSGIYAPPCSMKPQKAIILVAPGTYAGDITLDRAIAIIGPGFGKKASTDGAATVANGRGVDAATEAVYTGIVTMDLHGIKNDLYAAVSGMSFNGQDRVFVYDYSGIVQADHKKAQRYAYLNLSDIYAAPKSGLLFQGGYKDGALKWVESTDDSTLLNVNIDNSYLTNFAGSTSSNYIYGQMGGLNITDTTVNLDGTPACPLYKMTPWGKNFVVKPLRDYLRIENCYWKATASNYLMNYGPHGGSIKDTYGKASLATIVNNTFETDSILYRLTPAGVKMQSLIFTGNTVKRSTNSATAILAHSIKYGLTAADTEFATADISNNIIINSTSPWDLTASNNVNVDENFYGTADGKAQKISGGSGYEKSAGYYMNDKMVVKDTHFGLDLSAHCNKSTTALLPDFTVDANLICGTSAVAVDDIKAIDGCTILGIFEDAACTQQITDTITADIFYVKTKVGDVEVVFTVTFHKAVEHTYDDYKTTVPATCTEPGLAESVCTHCGATETRVLNPLNHPKTVREDRPATCTEDAGIFYVCVLCDEVFDSEIVAGSALGHDWGEWTEKVTGDCVTDTVMEHVCERCGIDETETITAPGHDWSDWYENFAPTCTDKGENGRFCYTCFEEETEEVDATGHDMQEVTIEPTCVEGGRIETVCTVCGEVDASLTIELDPTGNHTWGNYIVKDATCAVEGVSERFCTVCNCVDEDTRQTTPMDDTKHAYDAEGKDWIVVIEGDCVTDGLKERVCPDCQEKETMAIVAPGQHSYKEVTTAATHNQTGKVENVCSVCGDTVLVKLLPRLTDYKDLDAKAWYAGYMIKAVESGLFKGYNDNTIRPNANITRAEAVTLFARIAGVDTTKYTTNKFADVAKDAWYVGAVAWAEQNKIVSGRSGTTFDPNGNISRQELCTVLVRYADHAGIALNLKLAKANFADDATIANYAKDNVYLCQRAGIVSGRPGNCFAPTDFATRAEVAKILISFMEEYIG